MSKEYILKIGGIFSAFLGVMLLTAAFFTHEAAHVFAGVVLMTIFYGILPVFKWVRYYSIIVIIGAVFTITSYCFSCYWAESKLMGIFGIVVSLLYLTVVNISITLKKIVSDN